MNPETVSADSSSYNEVENPEVVGVNNTETNLLLPPAGATSASSNAEWQQYGEQIAAFIQAVPGYVSRFFQENKGPLGTIGLFLLVLVALRVTLAVLNAINSIPLVAPTFELIGMGYTFWFVYRYLLTATSRQELSEEFKNLKEQVLGTGS